jgi:hypothetical protein
MEDEWKEILVTYDRIEAEIIKDLLESGGIRVVVRSAKVTPYPVNVGNMGEIKILVKSSDAEAAREVVENKNI